MGYNMKDFIKKATNPKVLFNATIAFIISALATGLAIDFLFNKSHERYVVAGIIGVFLALFIVYLLASYIYRIVISLMLTAKSNGNLFRLYFKDKLFRTFVNKSITCFYILANAFMTFASSFTNYKWYYLSASAIFFVIFIMQLYLITNLSDSKIKQDKVIAGLTIFMAMACAGIVVMLSFNETAYSPKGLMIYWDAVYVFVTFTLVIVGIVNAIKSKNYVIGRFLAVRLSNAIFGMFTLTVTMLITFSEDFNQFRLLSIIVGSVSAALINAVAITQLVLANRNEDSD